MLPNLPALTSQWHVEEINVTMDPFGWTPLLLADPGRWYFSVCNVRSVPFIITTTPIDIAMPGGMLIGGGIAEFKYKDLGSLIGQQWFIYGNGSGDFVTVQSSSIVLGR